MKVYTVRSGDSLFKIAKRYGLTLKELLTFNLHIDDINDIDIGLKINIPRS